MINLLEPPIIVSACLMGVACRYDGGSKKWEPLRSALAGKAVVPVCPEQLGGLPTPRPPAHLAGGDGFDVLEGKARVVDDSGLDVTTPFRRGAEAVITIAKWTSARSCIFKARSPSCGVTGVTGVTAALCILHSLNVMEI